jgi:hypothetical protein
MESISTSHSGNSGVLCNGDDIEWDFQWDFIEAQIFPREKGIDETIGLPIQQFPRIVDDGWPSCQGAWEQGLPL